MSVYHPGCLSSKRIGLLTSVAGDKYIMLPTFVVEATYGDCAAACLLVHLLYRAIRFEEAQRNDGWFRFTASKIREMTGMKDDGQARARKKLRAMGILEERLEGMPRQVHYRVNLLKASEIIEGAAQIRREQIACVEASDEDTSPHAAAEIEPMAQSPASTRKPSPASTRKPSPASTRKPSPASTRKHYSINTSINTGNNEEGPYGPHAARAAGNDGADFDVGYHIEIGVNEPNRTASLQAPPEESIPYAEVVDDEHSSAAAGPAPAAEAPRVDWRERSQAEAVAHYKAAGDRLAQSKFLTVLYCQLYPARNQKTGAVTRPAGEVVFRAGRENNIGRMTKLRAEIDQMVQGRAGYDDGGTTIIGLLYKHAGDDGLLDWFNYITGIIQNHKQKQSNGKERLSSEEAQRRVLDAGDQLRAERAARRAQREGREAVR